MAFQRLINESRQHRFGVADGAPRLEASSSSEQPTPGAGLPPIELVAFLRDALRSFPQMGQPRELFDAEDLAQQLAMNGARSPADFSGQSVDELQSIWPPFAHTSRPFLVHLVKVMALPDMRVKRRKCDDREGGCFPIVQSSAGTSTTDGVISLDALRNAFTPLRDARRSTAPPKAALFSQILRELAAVPSDALTQRWILLTGSSPPDLPAARSSWLKGTVIQSPDSITDLLADDLIWRELGPWRLSAAQYASAVELWGRTASDAGLPAWPPTMALLQRFAFLFRNGISLSRYVSHIRSALRLVHAPLGALADTDCLIRGSIKLTPASTRRFKARATALDTQRLVSYARETLRNEEVAASWVVARHFCLRYGAEVVPLEWNGAHSHVLIDVANDGRQQVELTFMRRKLQNNPVTVTRRCICALQGKRLCGVCILAKRPERIGKVFPTLSYSDGLALLKVAAQGLQLPNALAWGTHAFRRGWADEALQAGGPTALFYSGGWRGVAAFGYASAKARGAIAAAEWLVEFSDSSESDE